MELVHQFELAATAEQAWVLLQDLESIAPCFPGATIESFSPEGFEGTVAIQLGPIRMQYRGRGQFTELNEPERRATLTASGRDRKGNGNASLTSVLQVVPTDEADVVTVRVVTDLAITGRAAQFGRGIIEEISNDVLRQFVDQLTEQIRTSTPEPPELAGSVGEHGTHTVDRTRARTAPPRIKVFSLLWSMLRRRWRRDG